MGLANGSFILRNPRIDDLAPVTVDALADTGALHLYIPDHVGFSCSSRRSTRKR